MSYKIQAFSANGVLIPQTSEKFLVLIQGFLDSSLKVFSATLPKLMRSEISVSVSGQPLYIPSKLQVPGEWTCSVYETMLQDAALSIDILRSRVHSLSNGTVDRYRFSDISVCLLDQYTGADPVYISTLRGAWLKSVSEVSLDWSRPTTGIVYNLRFRYSYIDTVLPSIKLGV